MGLVIMGGWIIEVYKFSIPVNMALSCYRRNILKRCRIMSPLLKMRRPRDNRNETAKTKKKKKPTQLQKDIISATK